MLGSVLVLIQALSKRGAFEGVKGEFCAIHLYRTSPRWMNGAEF